MADRRSQSDESLIIEYFTVQPLAACDAVLNQVADILRGRRPKKKDTNNDAKPAELPKPSQKRKAGKEATPITAECSKCPNPFGANIHHLTTEPDYHEFSEKTEFTASASG